MIRAHRMLLLAVATLLVFDAQAFEPATAPQSATTESTTPESVPIDNTVLYADLDLNSKSGVRTLYSRIRKAARYTCGTASLLRMVYGVATNGATQTYRQCRNHAIDDALSRLDAKIVERILAQ